MKKLFFLALLAFLYLPATTWADEHDENHESGNVGSGTGQVGDEVYDGEEENDYGSIVPSEIQLTYKILSLPDGEFGDTDYKNGTVELEGIYDSSGTYNPHGSNTVNVGALNIPHEIQVVTVEGSGTETKAVINLYTVVGIKRATSMGVGQGAFFSDPTITSVTIPYTIQYIGGYAFSQCTALGTVTVTDVATTTPSQLENIGQYAFQNSSITSINIPATLTTIGDYAFNNCSYLGVDLVLPETLDSLGTHAFQATGITSLVLPSSISSLPDYDFQGCTSLTTVTMNGSTQLGDYVFQNCSSLKSIILTGETPNENGGSETGTHDFGNDSGITLYVPTGAAAAYLKTNWASDVKSESALSWNFLDVEANEHAVDSEENYYATIYVDGDGYELYSNATAYYIPSVDVENGQYGTVSLEAVSGIIPANTALLVKASAAGDYYLYKEYGAVANDSILYGNMLYGSSEETTTTVGNAGNDDNYYFFKLSRKVDDDGNPIDKSVGFYWGADEGVAFLSGAGKAWLAVEKESFSNVKGFTLKFNDENDDTTGITAVETSAKAAVEGIYTLQGVRVNNMNQKGVYIVNGKKVIVK